MRDFSQSLSEAEREVTRLAEIAAQEKAMAEVLPIRFTNNMAAFEKYMPGIANSFKNYNTSRPIEFFCTENGAPNIKFMDTLDALYGNDPYAECSEQIDNVIKHGRLSRITAGNQENPVGFIHVDFLNKMVDCCKQYVKDGNLLQEVPDYLPCATIFGVGLGYHLGYLYERCNIGMLFLFEPDSDLFYSSLYAFDWASLLEHIFSNGLGLHIFVGQDEDNIISDLNSVLHKRGAFLVANAFPFWHYPSEKIFNLIYRFSSDYYLFTMGWGFFDDNMIALSHSISNVKSGIPFIHKDHKLPVEYRKSPVFIIANGPSLDYSIDTIKKFKDNAIIISCGSTISALYKYGIKPDIHVETERTKVVPDFLKLIKDEEYFKDILFLSSDVIHPECFDLFDRSCLCLKAEEPSYYLYRSHFSDYFNKCLVSGGLNPLVINIGITLSGHIGFENIYLFGVDGGFKEIDHHHSRLSAYYNTEESAQKLGQLTIGESYIETDGNFNGKVYTTPMFETARRVMESSIAFFPDLHCYNCSDGVKIKGATPLYSDVLNLKNTVFKEDIKDYIYSSMASPISIGDDFNVTDSLEIQFFDSLIDLIIKELNQVVKKRRSISDTLIRLYEYLVSLAYTDKMHIYKVLIGSVNYAFTIINSSAYLLDDEEKTELLLSDVISIFIEYLNKMKEIYPKAFNSVDMVENEQIMDLFR